MEKEKTYTEAQAKELLESKVNEAILAAKKQWDKECAKKIAAEKDEAARLAAMSADERARAELDKREKAFADEKKQYLTDKMEFEATKSLAKENLPVTFARLLSGEDIDATNKNIEMFKREFLKAIETALNERLKGQTPKTSPSVENNDPFLIGFGI